MPSAWGYSWGYSWGDSWGQIKQRKVGGLPQPAPTKKEIKKQVAVARKLVRELKAIEPAALPSMRSILPYGKVGIDFTALAQDELALDIIRDKIKRIKKRREEDALLVLAII